MVLLSVLELLLDGGWCTGSRGRVEDDERWVSYPLRFCSKVGMEKKSMSNKHWYIYGSDFLIRNDKTLNTYPIIQHLLEKP